MWGTRRRALIEHMRAGVRDVVILERGYVGCRFTHSSVSFGGGLNGRGEFRLIGSKPTLERFDRLGVKLTPWLGANDPEFRAMFGRHALIMGQVAGDMATYGVDLEQWYRDTRAALAAEGWASIKHRPHPGGKPWITRGIGGQAFMANSLESDLARAGLVVTFNSNSAVDAVIAGRPTVAMDRGSMAWEVTGRTVSDIVTPDRTDWAARLAWKQWTIEEFASGFCAEMVGLGNDGGSIQRTPADHATAG